MALVTPTNRDILTDIGEPPSADMTARLLLALTALYVQRPIHTAAEQQQYVELALRLIEKVDAATRAAVAGILQRCPDAPAEVFGRLGDMQSPPDGNAEDNAHSAREQHCICHQHLADGERAQMPVPSDAAPERRQPIPLTPEIGEAFFGASPAERRRLLSLIAPVGSDQVQAASEGGEHIYRRLDVAALQGRIGEFTREFERLLDIPKSLCERMLNDPSGEPMVVAAKATGVPIAILQRILLLINPAVSHSVQRVYDLSDLYHSLDLGAARDLLAMWSAQAVPNDPDPTPEARPAALERNPGALRDSSVASLRSRFGALTERLQGQAVNARPGPGSVARHGLRSR